MISILTAIISFARVSGLETTAKYIETEERKELFKKLNIDTMQGYLYSPPVPAAKFKEYLAELS